MSESIHRELALQIAAQCWCYPETASIPMNEVLCEVFAYRVEQLLVDSAQYLGNSEFYRSLLVETSKHLGPSVFVCDDGSISEDPLLLKVPELVKELALS